jgi:Icc-related predicted phosphoesterase
MGRIKIVCVSDTHLAHQDKGARFPYMPAGDIIIHAGDATYQGSPTEIQHFINWFSKLDYKHKVFVSGNHDWLFQRNPALARAMLADAGIIYLEDSEITIAGLRIYGSPWQPKFGDWAFNLPRGEALKQVWDKIPEGIDILVTHGPPWGVGDQLFGGRRAGCEELDKAVARVKPRLHVFGHIHRGYGFYKKGIYVPCDSVNAAICDESYYPANQPIVVKLDIRD